ncbi:MAG: hypothetical protein V4459_08945 [Pseudomonadota bacterium]
MALTIFIANLQAGKSLEIALNDGVSTWSIRARSARIPGFTIASVPAGQLVLATLSITETALICTAGSSAGSLVLHAHIALPDGVAASSGFTDAGGDTNVNVTCSTADGLECELSGDWTISFDDETAAKRCD